MSCDDQTPERTLTYSRFDQFLREAVMIRTRLRKHCMGCLALAKQTSGRPGVWNAGCSLGYPNEVRDAGFVYPAPVPQELCPCPRTVKELELLKGRAKV